MGSYAPPSFSSAGLSIPTYQQILAYYLTAYLNIYGQDNSTDNSNADVQLISILALAASDAVACLQLAYLNCSPATATGAALSSIVKLNGIARKVASYSTVVVTLTGSTGTTITNGIVTDTVYGYQWSLPPSVYIDGSGTVNVVAVCNVLGAVSVPAGSFNSSSIATPTSGWTGVSNSAASTVGAPVEADSQLRTRQALSVALPSITVLAGTIAAIAAVEGVTRYNVLENFTNATDTYGNPAHSVTAVVEGGTALAVATAIFNNRGIGPLTNGDVSGSPISQTQSVPVTDPNSGITIDIGFIQPPVYVNIYIVVNAHATGGLTTAQIEAIQAALVAYGAELQIGESVNFAELIQAAASVNPNPAEPTVAIRTPFYFGTSASPTTSTDVAMNFYQVAQILTANITVNSV